jgi:hypothetical protein
MNNQRLSFLLKHEALHYDVRREKRKDYNRYALAQYLKRIDEMLEELPDDADISDVRRAVSDNFNDRLRDAMHRAVDAYERTTK